MGAMADLSERRLISGYLDHVIDTRTAKRWAVLEKSADGDSLTLRLFRDENETNEKLKYTYILSKDNFIGTERGSVRQYNKKSPALYWAIITVRDQTLLFQDSHNSVKTVSIFERWDKKLKDFWKHQSWLVKPLEGANSFTKESGLTLHINWASVCLAYLNPPRHYLRWCLDTLEQVSYDNTKLSFTVMKDNNNSGSYEVKTEKERFAAKIKEVIENLRSRYMGQNQICPNDNQMASVEGPNLHLEWVSLNPVPHQERGAPSSPSDQSMKDTIHMDQSIMRQSSPDPCPCRYPPKPQSGDGGTNHRKMSEPKAAGIPLIKIVPVLETESRGEFESYQKQCPFITPRTKVCALTGQVHPMCRSDNKVGLKLDKGMSASTSKLPDISSEHARDTSFDLSPSTEGRALPRLPKKMDSPNGSGVTSAVHLPLPKPPVTSSSSNEKLSWVKLPEECVSVFDSMSSIPSQASDVTSMDMTQSMSSLSSEEDRGRCSSAESRMTSPIRKSVLSLSAISNPPSDTKNPPGYGRSYSVPAELPQSHTHSFTEYAEPEYMSTESLGEGYFKKSEPHSTEESNYINLSSDQSIYVNPGLTSPNNILPLPPRPGRKPCIPPQRTPVQPVCGTERCESMELHEVLDAMLNGKELGCSMGLPHSVLVKFCVMCDTERNVHPPKNWKGLAEQLGLGCSDIYMVDDYCRRYHKKPTQVILAYWEKQAEPERPFKKSELVSILHILERQDLLDVIIQREKHAGGK